MRFLFVDRILQMTLGESIRGVKHITRDDYYLSRDNRGQLCFIPSLVGETLGQLAAWNVMAHNDFTQRPVAGVVSRAQLHRPAYVGETLLLEAFIDALDETAVQYHAIARVGDDVVFSLEGALGPLLPMHDFIDTDCVRRQFAEINRPGEWPISVAMKSHDLLSTEHTVRTPPFLFDRITTNIPGVSLTAEKCITRAAAYFPDHFPKKPVLPLTVLLECKLNLADEFVRRAGWTQSYRIQELRKIKMSEFVAPGEIVNTTVTVKRQDANELILNFLSEVNGKRVCVLDVIMASYNKPSIGYV